MTSQARPLSSIRLPGQRKRRVARRLLKLHLVCVLPAAQPSREDTLRVVCISDTHNTRPELLFGDVLIHPGDLTETGSFDDIQTELRWLSSQPHQYKVFVAGNHDVLLDGEFLKEPPERRYGSLHTKEDLDWGSVIYLQNSSVTLDFLRNPPKCEQIWDHSVDRAYDLSCSKTRNIWQPFHTSVRHIGFPVQPRSPILGRNICSLAHETGYPCHPWATKVPS